MKLSLFLFQQDVVTLTEIQGIQYLHIILSFAFIQLIFPSNNTIKHLFFSILFAFVVYF